jgi:hypothetical protein
MRRSSARIVAPSVPPPSSGGGSYGVRDGGGCADGPGGGVRPGRERAHLADGRLTAAEPPEPLQRRLGPRVARRCGGEQREHVLGARGGPSAEHAPILLGKCRRTGGRNHRSMVPVHAWLTP